MCIIVCLINVIKSVRLIDRFGFEIRLPDLVLV